MRPHYFSLILNHPNKVRVALRRALECYGMEPSGIREGTINDAPALQWQDAGRFVEIYFSGADRLEVFHTFPVNARGSLLRGIFSQILA